MKTTLSAFATDIFDQLADWWKVEVAISSITLVDCCDDKDCGDKTQECIAIVSRSGADPIKLTTYWEPGYDVRPRITPAAMLREMGDSVNSVPEKGATPATPEHLAAVKAFCWVHDGLEPHLWPSHLAAFAMTADALELFIETPSFEVVVCSD